MFYIVYIYYKKKILIHIWTFELDAFKVSDWVKPSKKEQNDNANLMYTWTFVNVTFNQWLILVLSQFIDDLCI